MNEEKNMSERLNVSFLQYLWASSPINLNFAPDYHGFFKKIKLLNSFTDNEIRIFTKYLRIRTFSKDEVIFQQGETGYGIYFIFTGSVNIFAQHHSSEKGEFILKLSTLEYFGEMGLLEEFNRRTATVISNENTVLLGLFKPDLDKLLEQHPVIGAKFLKETALIMAGRIGDLTKEILNLRKTIKNLEDKK